MILAVSFGGGTLLSDCQGLVKDSVVGTIRQTLTSPNTTAEIAAALLGEFDQEDGTGD